MPGAFPLVGIVIGVLFGIAIAQRGGRRPSLLTYVLWVAPLVAVLWFVGIIFEPAGLGRIPLEQQD